VKGEPVTVHVHIERLVLDGLPVPPAQRPVLQAAVEAELARRLATGDPRSGPLSGGTFARLATQTIHLSAQSNAGTLGRQIADAVHTGLTRD
jgi:hypothetical protein